MLSRMILFIQIGSDVGAGAPPWVLMCQTATQLNFNLCSLQLHNPSLELRRASESSTTTAGEVLPQLGDASLIRSEMRNT